MGILDGKVAIVTGAGQGLGRIESLELARLGASVVVNDLGTQPDGSGASEELAQSVVQEIEELGAKAVAAFGDVANWDDAQRIVQTAVDTFGDLNILVNNAGFSRDGMIVKMTEEMWDSVIRVHMKGHFAMIKHTMAYWREKSKAQGGEPLYGRLISTASDSFLMGNLGQPNYAAAKAGIAYLTMSAARECQRLGATANVILPRARTRMTMSGPWAGIFEKPEDGFDTFAPEHIGPLVAWISSPQAAHVSGQLLQIWGKHIRVYEQPQAALDHENQDPWTIEGLDEVLGSFFEGKKPVDDGFMLPMG
ncbi:MAG: SDR family NAD(P)-dependent oxidoreductase [bacterium]|nr:SDR family NAD(P)-dependent oxidoreductase [bacterium]MCP5067150.1 SDR family NAD(P)-dependent oxidoreductase [bacterium]